jgi:hypothetical protein
MALTALEERTVRCARCNRRLPVAGAQHPCRTIEEQLETLRAMSREIAASKVDTKAMPARRPYDGPVDQWRERADLA